MGNNTLADVVDHVVTDASNFNQFKTALAGDLYPRNSNGEATSLAGGLGASGIRFEEINAETMNCESIDAEDSVTVGDLEISGDSITKGDNGIIVINGAGGVSRTLADKTTTVNFANSERCLITGSTSSLSHTTNYIVSTSGASGRILFALRTWRSGTIVTDQIWLRGNNDVDTYEKAIIWAEAGDAILTSGKSSTSNSSHYAGSNTFKFTIKTGGGAGTLYWKLIIMELP